MSLQRLNLSPVLSFWLPLTFKEWFGGGVEFDSLIKSKFEKTLSDLATASLAEQTETAQTSLASIIVFDQFTRNMYRDTPKQWDYDQNAIEIAEKAIELGQDLELVEKDRVWMYMPYMHSENSKMQEKSVKLFESLSDKSFLKYAITHKEVIDSHGRYPSRNEILGRVSTQAELEYIKNGGHF